MACSPVWIFVGDSNSLVDRHKVEACLLLVLLQYDNSLVDVIINFFAN